MATYTEKADFKTLKNKLALPKDRFERVENLMVSGMPDISYTINGVDGWIEQKALKKEPKNSSSKIMAGTHLSGVQLNWWLGYTRAGGNGYLFISTPKRFLLLHGVQFEYINNLSLREAIDRSIWHVTRPIRNKKQWTKLRQILSTKRHQKSIKSNVSSCSEARRTTLTLPKWEPEKHG